MKYARILLLEDDPDWIESLTHLFEEHGAVVFSASSTRLAEGILQTKYVNVAIVDVNMRLGDTHNSEGMTFLETIRTLGLGEVVQPIIVSGFPDFDRVRRAFHDYSVVDFLPKSPFQPDSVVAAVREGLNRVGLWGEMEIEIEGNLGMADLLLRHQWARREDMQELVVEFRDMLRRLFPKAEHLFIRPLPAGQSGAGVLEVEPTLPDGVGAATIVKFGKKDKIQQESRNVSEYVNDFASAQSSTQVSAVCQRTIAAIRYQLVGTSVGRVMDFGDYYPTHTVQEITEGVLNNLLRVTCGLWYDNRTQHRRRINLIDLYSQALSIEWQKVREAMEALTGVHKQNGAIAFFGVGGHFLDPLVWLERTPHYYVNGWQSITHGDLNQHNILISPDNQCWLIDFYRTGQGHILRDLVELEAVIKISLTHLPDLESHRRLEQLLLDHPDIDKLPLPPASDPLHKPLAVIAYLRRFAGHLTGKDQDMREYNAALLMQLYKMLSLDFLRDDHEKILLSAAMLCGWLDRMGN
jgi:DNA-binding response OmpR family regulator